MEIIQHIPRVVWRLFRLPPRLAYAIGLGPLIGRLVLLLTTTGRRTGRSRVTPLQYEEVEGRYYVAAARGMRTDWLQNLEADPRATIRVGALQLQCHAEVIRDVDQIADFLTLRLEKHPRMVGAIMRAAGFPSSPDRELLLAYAKGRPLVRLEPLPNAAAPTRA